MAQEQKENQGVVTFAGNPVTLLGELIKVGDTAPDFTAVGEGLKPARLSDYKGKTVILSSHVMATVQQLCTHVAIIDKGRVLVAGTTDEVAQGGDLGERFTSLVGGVHSEEGLSWLGN